jgi:hypothetical protein
MEELGLGDDLTYSERPVKILDTTERVTHNKVNTKKSSEQITPNYSQALPESRGEILLREVGL